METTVIREEVQAYLQGSLAFAEFCRNNELTTAEREALGTLAQTLGLTVHPVPPPDGPPLADTLSNLPPIE
jgi:hypothetical protein